MRPQNTLMSQNRIENAAMCEVFYTSRQISVLGVPATYSINQKHRDTLKDDAYIIACSIRSTLLTA